MSLAATSVFANPDPNSNPLTIVELIALLNTLITTIVPGDYKPYVVQTATPGVDDQDKVWHKIDADGRPLGTFLFYLGTWRKQYVGLPSETKMFYGDPTADFDVNGKGIIGSNWDGWQLMNGKNGTANLSNRFVIGGQMDNVDFTGFSGGWRTGVNGVPESTGGAATITLDINNTFESVTPAANVSPFSASGQARADGSGSSGALYGGLGDGTHDKIELVAANPGNPTPTPISTIPPFFAIAFVQWVGYA